MTVAAIRDDTIPGNAQRRDGPTMTHRQAARMIERNLTRLAIGLAALCLLGRPSDVRPERSLWSTGWARRVGVLFDQHSCPILPAEKTTSLGLL